MEISTIFKKKQFTFSLWRNFYVVGVGKRDVELGVRGRGGTRVMNLN